MKCFQQTILDITQLGIDPFEGGILGAFSSTTGDKGNMVTSGIGDGSEAVKAIREYASARHQTGPGIANDFGPVAVSQGQAEFVRLYAPTYRKAVARRVTLGSMPVNRAVAAIRSPNTGKSRYEKHHLHRWTGRCRPDCVVVFRLSIKR